MKLIFTSIFIWAFAHLTAQNRLYVKTDATGMNNGQSWADAYPNLQDALQDAQAGDEVWIAQGVYLPTTTTDRTISFEPVSGVRLYGGFAGYETNLNDRDWTTYPTILSGNIGNGSDSTDNSINVMYLLEPDTTTIIDGLIIQNGVADDQVSNALFRGKSGGGIYIMGENGNAYPEIRNCVFRHNTAANFGGGVMVYGGNNGSVAPRIINCRFEFNHAVGGYGGGLARIGGSWIERGVDLEGCDFYLNKAGFIGGGFYYRDTERNDLLEIEDCTFERNQASSKGGGVYLTIGRQIPKGYSMTGTVFKENRSENYGAFASVLQGFGETSTIKIDHCVFEYNINLLSNQLFSPMVYMEHYNSIGGKAEILNCKIMDNGNMSHVWSFEFQNADVLIDKVIFERNSAYNLLNVSVTKNLHIKNTTFFDNNNFYTLLGNAGGRKVVMENCLMAKNTSLDLGVYNDFYDLDTIIRKNCTIVDNAIPENSETTDVYCVVENCIIRDIDNLFDFLGSDTNGKYSYCSFDSIRCDWISINICGPGNIAGLDPMFRDTAAGDYSLLPCSPLINAGSNLAASGILTDLIGNPRIQEGIVDIGAYETPAFSLAAEPTIKPACVGSSNGSILLHPVFGCEPYDYQWFPDAGDGPELTGLPPGTYQLTLTDGSGRKILDTLLVGLAPNPELAPLSTDVQCGNPLGGTITAGTGNGTAPYHYAWQPAAPDTAYLSHLSPGAYALTVTDANGCKDSASTLIALQGMISLMIGGRTISCFGESDGWLSATPATGASPFTWQWTGWPGTDSLAQPLGPGNYSVTVSDRYGCTASNTFPTMNAPDSLVIGTGTSPQTQNNPPNGAAVVTTVSGGTSPFDYFWETGGTDQSIAGLSAGLYTVTVTDDRGCTASATVEVKLMVGTADLELMALLIYPNPATDWVEVVLRGSHGLNGGQAFADVSQMELSDESGRVLRRVEWAKGAVAGVLDLRGLPSGMYWLRGRNAAGLELFVGKVMKR